MKRISAATTALTLTSTANAFISTQPQPAFSRSTQQGPLQMGLFDGMKEAFSAPPAMSLDSERETPIDRWDGISRRKGLKK